MENPSNNSTSKKVGSNVELSNYCPVNTLPYISKIAEKAMVLQFSKYIEDKLPEYISAYRDGFSTEMVLLGINDDILMSMDSQRITSMVCTDLSTAFDTVDIEVMLAVLEKSYGVQDMVLTWCKSYLTKTQARVKIKHELSEKSDINFSVTQGSVLGPILFNLYVSTLSYDIRDLPLQLSGYADDHEAHNTFNANSREEEEHSNEKLESFLSIIKNWMDANHLKINISKTEYIKFGNSRQLGKCTSNKINFEDIHI